MLKEKYDNLSKRKKGTIYVIAYVFCIVIIALLLNGFIISPLRVIGNSMNPSLTDGDIVFIDKLSYKLDDPERFDLVVFPYKYDNNTNFIKRIIGLPGEKVEIINKKIFVNDSELEEYYGIYDEKLLTQYENYGPRQLDYDEYFVMGDNRNHSEDSRSSDVGAVNIDEIIGKACFRVWPFNSFGSLKYQ